MNYSTEYRNLLTLIRNCSDYLDKESIVLSGSPQLVDNIKEHYKRQPENYHTIYGMALVSAFEKLNICISSDKDRLELFLEKN